MNLFSEIMALVVDQANLFFDTVALRMKPLRDALLLAGLFYGSKLAFKGCCGLYQGFKTFALPYVWPRNFSKEYGQWAGINPFFCSTFFCIRLYI